MQISLFAYLMNGTSEKMRQKSPTLNISPPLPMYRVRQPFQVLV